MICCKNVVDIASLFGFLNLVTTPHRHGNKLRPPNADLGSVVRC